MINTTYLLDKNGLDIDPNKFIDSEDYEYDNFLNKTESINFRIFIVPNSYLEKFQIGIYIPPYEKHTERYITLIEPPPTIYSRNLYGPRAYFFDSKEAAENHLNELFDKVKEQNKIRAAFRTQQTYEYTRKN